ncbi:MAG TPA: Gfo/Idh/MocA family oxidoreductase [Candidatus Acidoferrum sp.]|nr:Gfo/Idh/MocA family oxidoreductase [Candidatus Acidoferrum sp.]
MTGQTTRVAVVGAGEFGRNHVRVWREIEGADLAGVFDANPSRAAQIAAEFSTHSFPSLQSLLAEGVEAVSLAVPTKAHASVGSQLLQGGVDVLVEKPIASSLAEADQLISAARAGRRILQVGQVERFNPAVVAAQKILSRPLFFEVHRLGIFTPRSLDIDVVYDVMIHDLDILLTLVGAPVTDLRAVGIPVVTDKVDIAHVRLEFSTGTVANLTASRVSTERVRKMRFFQEHEYISLDFGRRDVLRIRVNPRAAEQPEIGFEKLPTGSEEPLHAELRAFLDSVRTRRSPVVDGSAGRAALELADQVMAGILEHARRVQLGAFSPQGAR